MYQTVAVFRGHAPWVSVPDVLDRIVSALNARRVRQLPREVLQFIPIFTGILSVVSQSLEGEALSVIKEQLRNPGIYGDAEDWECIPHGFSLTEFVQYLSSSPEDQRTSPVERFARDGWMTQLGETVFRGLVALVSMIFATNPGEMTAEQLIDKVGRCVPIPALEERLLVTDMTDSRRELWRSRAGWVVCMMLAPELVAVKFYRKLTGSNTESTVPLLWETLKCEHLRYHDETESWVTTANATASVPRNRRRLPHLNARQVRAGDGDSTHADGTRLSYVTSSSSSSSSSSGSDHTYGRLAKSMSRTIRRDLDTSLTCRRGCCEPRDMFVCRVHAQRDVCMVVGSMQSACGTFWYIFRSLVQSLTDVGLIRAYETAKTDNERRGLGARLHTSHGRRWRKGDPKAESFDICREPFWETLVTVNKAEQLQDWTFTRVKGGPHSRYNPTARETARIVAVAEKLRRHGVSHFLDGHFVIDGLSAPRDSALYEGLVMVVLNEFGGRGAYPVCMKCHCWRNRAACFGSAVHAPACTHCEDWGYRRQWADAIFWLLYTGELTLD